MAGVLPLLSAAVGVGVTVPGMAVGVTALPESSTWIKGPWM